MRSLKTYSQLFIAILLASFVTGCVAALPPRPSSDFAYYPKAQPGIATVEAAKSDLALMLKDTDIEVSRRKDYQFANEGELTKLMEEYKRRGGNFDGLTGLTYIKEPPSMEITYVSLDIKAFPVSDDRIELPFDPPLLYRDLLNENLVVNVDDWGYVINFANTLKFRFPFGPRDLTSAQRFADDLFVIQEHLKKQEQVFEEQAANYRALAVKPTVSEAQRKLFVQANALSQQKNYLGALDFYHKALEIAPLSYPEAYFNMALLEAQENRFRLAIGSMKKYLLLKPDADDFRSAQDKIYEWELMISPAPPPGHRR